MHIICKNKGILNTLAKSLFFICCPLNMQNKWKCLKIKTKLLKYVPIQYISRFEVDASILGSDALCRSRRLESPFKISLGSHNDPASHLMQHR